MGTPAYLAPERLDGLPATFRSDLYAFGVVLYEGAGRSQGLSRLHTAQRGLCGAAPELVPLVQRRPDLPVHLVSVVEQAMDATLSGASRRRRRWPSLLPRGQS